MKLLTQNKIEMTVKKKKRKGEDINDKEGKEEDGEKGEETEKQNKIKLKPVSGIHSLY